MLRPDRMSRVSVTGTRSVMGDAIETIHDLNLLHLSEYDGSWEGFDPGDPIEGAEEVSEQLVTIRSLENILDLESADGLEPDPASEDDIEDRLESIRTEVNDLDDRRNDLRGTLRETEERIDAIEPFADLGIDLDLLSGYDSLAVAVGEGDQSDVEPALSELDCPAETFSGGELVAVYAHTSEEELNDALVNTAFTATEVPAGEGSPEERLTSLREKRQRIESELTDIEASFEEIKREQGGFLLAVEERLSIEVQQAEAPLAFATTENAFVAEGWIPTDRYDELDRALSEAVGDRVETEELERASYDRHGHAEETQTATDGGEAPIDAGDPPVVLDNSGPISSMELLVETIELPRYDEFDPTWLLMLSFPLFFGYMIGDVVYGLGYATIGYLMMTRFDSEAIRKLGGVGVWCGAFTMLFGVLYGEFLGLHAPGEVVWETLHGIASVFPEHAPIEKGLTGETAFIQAWMLITLIVGIVHVTVGHVLSFFKEFFNHGLKPAVFESGSWIVLMIGVWGWVFAVLPDIGGSLFEAAFEEAIHVPALAHGLPPELATPMLAVMAVGTVMLGIGEGIKAVEILQVLVNVLSYLRLLAVLLAKAGMAFVVNLFVFGLYEKPDGLHFLTFGEPSEGTVIFQGLFNMDGTVGLVALLFGVVVLVVGHLLVFALGVTSAGLQSLRLEYVEFFGKFYTGGGRKFNPFGHEKQHTSEN